MKLAHKLTSSLHTQIRYPFSLINRVPRKTKLIEEEFGRLEYKSPKTIYGEIMALQNYHLIPLYLKFYHKFPYRGVNRKTNYQLYMVYLSSLRRQIKRRPLDQAVKSNLDADKIVKIIQIQFTAKNLLILMVFQLIGVLIFGYWWTSDKIVKSFDIQSSKFTKNANSPNESNTLDENLLLSKLFDGLKCLKIAQAEGSNCTYKIKFEYENTPTEEFSFIGDINNVLAMLQTYESGKFKHTPVHFEHEKYKITHTFSDVFSFLVPFLGIAITVFIFRRMSPDTILSKLNPKKSYKIEGLRDIKVKFADVAGMQQAKRQITEFVDFLKHGEKYKQMGAKIPKGALLTGPPGTGKTMLAKACAGEAGVTFFYISGSQFVELFVGVGASKVRELFARARMEAPSIIFIDQIDAIGKKRQTSRNQEKDSTLNQLLVQMDGFGSHETVIVLAATNRKDILDSALTRPGRFDRMVEVTLPDIKAREEIFKVHLKPLKVNPNKKLEDIAKRLSELSPGFSGADIANLCNEAAIIATRRKQVYIEDKDFEDASQRITAGYEKKGLVNPKTKKRVAYHEAGHAVCGWFLKGGDPLVKLTIIPRSKGALGYAQYLPKSAYIKTRTDLIDQIAILMGGLASEEINFGQLSSGASDDLQRVYQVSRQMVAQFGMGKHSYNVTIDQESYVRKESQFLSKRMDDDMMEIVNLGYERCRQVLTKNKEVLEKLAEMLLEKETINGEDIKAVLGERPSFS